MRLMPHPPALDESKKAKHDGSPLNLSTTTWRLLAAIWPSRRTNLPRVAKGGTTLHVSARGGHAIYVPSRAVGWDGRSGRAHAREARSVEDGLEEVERLRRVGDEHKPIGAGALR